MDLLVLIILVRTCYSGYDRGLLAEILHLAGLVTVTALTINFAGVATAWVHAMMPWHPAELPAIIFWVLFLTLLGVKQLLIKSVTGVMKWERLHWAIQGLGVVLGALRGVWWSGLLLLALAGSGFDYLKTSVEERSLLGGRLLPLTQPAIVAAADALPGADQRSTPLIPALYHPAESKAPRS